MTKTPDSAGEIAYMYENVGNETSPMLYILYKNQLKMEQSYM